MEASVKRTGDWLSVLFVIGGLSVTIVVAEGSLEISVGRDG